MCASCHCRTSILCTKLGRCSLQKTYKKVFYPFWIFREGACFWKCLMFIQNFKNQWCRNSDNKYSASQIFLHEKRYQIKKTKKNLLLFCNYMQSKRENHNLKTENMGKKWAPPKQTNPSQFVHAKLSFAFLFACRISQKGFIGLIWRKTLKQEFYRAKDSWYKPVLVIWFYLHDVLDRSANREAPLNLSI